MTRTQAPSAPLHRDNVAMLQNLTARERRRGDLELAACAARAARAYRLTLPAQSLIGA